MHGHVTGLAIRPAPRGSAIGAERKAVEPRILGAIRCRDTLEHTEFVERQIEFQRRGAELSGAAGEGDMGAKLRCRSGDSGCRHATRHRGVQSQQRCIWHERQRTAAARAARDFGAQTRGQRGGQRVAQKAKRHMVVRGRNQPPASTRAPGSAPRVRPDRLGIPSSR